MVPRGNGGAFSVDPDPYTNDNNAGLPRNYMDYREIGHFPDSVRTKTAGLGCVVCDKICLRCGWDRKQDYEWSYRKAARRMARPRLLAEMPNPRSNKLSAAA